MAVISATNVELPTRVSTALEDTYLRNKESRCPYFVGTEPGELMQHGSTKIITWQAMANLTPVTSALAEQTTNAAYLGGRTAVGLSTSVVTATPAKYGNYVIPNEEVMKYNSLSQYDKIVQVLGINAGQSLNYLQRNEAEDNLTTVYAGGAASDGAVNSAITLASIKYVLNQLDRNSALTFTPMSAMSDEGSPSIGGQGYSGNGLMPAYVGICHPDVAVDIAGLNGFIEATRYAGRVSLYMSEFGSLTVAGRTVRFLCTEDASIDADSGAAASSFGLNGTSAIDLYSTVIYGMECLGSAGFGTRYDDGSYMAGDYPAPAELIIKGLGSGGTSDPYDEIATMAWKAWHDGVVLNSDWGYAIRSGATDLSS